MNKHILVSVIVFLLLLIVVLVSTNNERFNDFIPLEGMESCLRSVIEDTQNQGENPEECVEKCYNINKINTCNPVA